MSSPNRLNFEDIPETPGDNGLPPPDSPVIPRGPAAPDSPVAAAAGAPLNSQGAQSPSREELEDFYRELDRSRRFNRQLFLEAENEDEEDPEVAMLEERFGEELINAYVALSGAGWISAIKRDHGYEPLQDGLVPRSGAAGKKRKKTTKTTKKKEKRHRKRGGGKKKNKKKRTKKKSRRRTKNAARKRREKKEVDMIWIQGKYIFIKESAAIGYLKERISKRMEQMFFLMIGQGLKSRVKILEG